LERVCARAPELWALIDEAGAATVERDGTMLRAHIGGGVEELPPVWWTSHAKTGPPMLMGWVGGPRSAMLQGRTAEELGGEACRTLARILGFRMSASLPN
jgi:hypothetical protein